MENSGSASWNCQFKICSQSLQCFCHNRMQNTRQYPLFLSAFKRSCFHRWIQRKCPHRQISMHSCKPKESFHYGYSSWPYTVSSYFLFSGNRSCSAAQSKVFRLWYVAALRGSCPYFFFQTLKSALINIIFLSGRSPGQWRMYANVCRRPWPLLCVNIISAAISFSWQDIISWQKILIIRSRC